MRHALKDSFLKSYKDKKKYKKSVDKAKLITYNILNE